VIFVFEILSQSVFEELEFGGEVGVCFGVLARLQFVDLVETTIERTSICEDRGGGSVRFQCFSF
jgi:hypothetical protein